MSSNASQKNLIWEAKKYHDLAIGQFTSAMELIENLNIISESVILDVGCGDGKITAELAKKVSKGFVLGVDPSKEMISFAKKTFGKKSSNLFFDIQKAENLEVNEKFDIIFSSFALQWVENKSSFFRSSHSFLKNQGTLALIVPLEISVELNFSLEKIISLPIWNSYFRTFKPSWYFESQKTIEHLINENAFSITYSSYEIQDVYFQSKKNFEDYILLWFPYLDPIPEFLQKKFFRDVMDYYYEIMSKKFNFNDQEFIIKIPQLTVIAKKTI
ncbi:MAG: Trans-aconitate 2-methyltransferase [Chlamydiae bacterium]|nr:Trans-aconitate 2-methyltransferase [Chlamydiota bacterium]